MGQSKTLPFYRLLLLWYFIPDGASSEYCFNDEDDSVQNCEWGCCESDTMKHCCISPYAIAGIVCGSIGGVCTIVALTICWRLYKKRHGQVVKNPQSQSVMVLSGFTEMGQSKTLPFYRLILLWYFLTDGASSEYCFNDEDDTVENCSYGCCTSENFKHCCTSPYVIAGIVCGSVGGVCTIVALILCCRYYKKQRAQVVNNPQIQPAMVLSGNVPQQQYNGYNTGYNSQYNGTPPTSYSHQAQYPPAPSGLSVPPAYTYVPPSSDLSAATANNPFAAAANQAAGRTPTAK